VTVCVQTPQTRGEVLPTPKRAGQSEALFGGRSWSPPCGVPQRGSREQDFSVAPPGSLGPLPVEPLDARAAFETGRGRYPKDLCESLFVRGVLGDKPEQR